MNIVDIVRVKYPGQFEAGNVSFYYDENEIINISLWTVPNEPQPTNDELFAWGLANERAVDLNSLALSYAPLIQNHIDLIAFKRGYTDGVACTTYSASTVFSWKADALVFIPWRDSAWNYAYNLLATLSSNQDPIPTIDQVIAGIPVIQWPN